MLVKSLKDLRKKWDKNIELRKGKEYLEKHKESLDKQWTYLIEGGFIEELPKEE
jgi:hypothetical protein